MPSTYSTNLRLELIATGEKSGTWGTTTNVNLGTLIEEAIGGYVSVAVSDSTDTTLTTNNGSSDQARNMVVNLTGALSASRNVICPTSEKLYVVKNSTAGGFAVTFKVAGQTGVSIPNGATVFLYVDGTDVRNITGSIATQSANNVAITGGTITGISSQTITANGAGDALRITQTGTGNALVVEDSANPDSTPFVVDASGSVGIGQSPVSNRKLTVATDRTVIPYGTVLSTYNGGLFENDIITGFDGTSGFIGNFQNYRFDIMTNALPRVIVSSSGDVGIGSSPSAGVKLDVAGQIRSTDGTVDIRSIPLAASTAGLFGTVTNHDMVLITNNTERVRLNTSGSIGFNGLNYGTSGQALISGGSSASPSWGTLGVAGGGTGATSAAAARTNLGLAIGTNVQAYDATLQSISALGTAADKYAYTTGVNTWAEGTITAAGRAILDDADASTQRTTLGLAIGTNVQAYDATLQSISALGTAADKYAYTTGVNTWAEGTITAAGRAILDDADASTQRTTLGLGSAATLNAGTAANNVVQLDGTAKLPAVDGSQLTNLPSAPSSGRLLRTPQTLTSGTSYTTPAGCNTIYVEAVGGGGGGGSASGGPDSDDSAGGSGGGSGAYAAKYFSVSPSTAYSYAIGAGGTAGSGAGGNGGSTTFTVGATTITAGGGGGGGTGSFANSSSGGSGGTASNGDTNIRGSGGGAGGGSSGTGNTNTGMPGGHGGGSFFGGGGRGSFNASGQAGESGGGGSGGANSGSGTLNGGAGGAGLIRIWEYS